MKSLHVVLVFAILGLRGYAEPLRPSSAIAPVQFFSRPSGSVAFLKGKEGSKSEAAQAAFLSMLAGSGSYILPKQDKYWFVINHASAEEGVSFLRIKIVTFFRPGTSVPVQGYLTRSGEWFRPSVAKLQDPFTPVKLRSDEFGAFLTAHQKTNTTELDASLHGRLWHGLPMNSEDNSWDDRQVWVQAVPKDYGTSRDFYSQFGKPIGDSNPFIMNGLLIRFQQRPKVNSYSDRPLMFSFEGADVVAAYVAIHSPISASFNREFFLTFD